jgi:hypothetical protein
MSTKNNIRSLFALCMLSSTGLFAQAAPADGGWAWNWNSYIFVGFLAIVGFVTLVGIIKAKQTLVSIGNPSAELSNGLFESYFRWFAENKIWVGICIAFFALCFICLAA